jgi:hypothetical protein
MMSKTRMIDPITQGCAFSLLDADAKDNFNKHIYKFMKYVGNPCHPKAHTFFFHAKGPEPMQMDLSTVYMWCKGSQIINHLNKPSDTFMPFVIRTPLVSGFLCIMPLLNADRCKAMLVDGDKALQVRVTFDEGFTGTVVIGVSIHTNGRCTNCDKSAMERTLKACSRCFETDRVRVLYCSKRCQKIDYPRHKAACCFDWESSDWQEKIEI